MHRAMLLLCASLALAGCTTEPTASVDGQASAPSEVASAPGESVQLGMAVPAVAAVEPTSAPVTSAGYSDFTTTIQSAGYQHAHLEAMVGATIFWWNVDDKTHSVYSDDGQFASSGPLAPGMEFGRTFLQPGEYGYHCMFHPDMTGVVVVR